MRVGLITYNKLVNERIRFDQFDDKESLVNYSVLESERFRKFGNALYLNQLVSNWLYVLEIPYNGKGTYTNKAITWATEQGMVEAKGDRPDVPNFIIVLTDGK